MTVDRTSNTNEKAQSAEGYLKSLDIPIGNISYFGQKWFRTVDFLTGFLRFHKDSRISQLESALAKSQEKCKAYEGALEKLVQLKKYKDQFGKDAEYKAMQPLVWDIANTVLQSES